MSRARFADAGQVVRSAEVAATLRCVAAMLVTARDLAETVEDDARGPPRTHFVRDVAWSIDQLRASVLGIADKIAQDVTANKDG